MWNLFVTLISFLLVSFFAFLRRQRAVAVVIIVQMKTSAPQLQPPKNLTPIGLTDQKLWPFKVWQ